MENDYQAGEVKKNEQNYEKPVQVVHSHSLELKMKTYEEVMVERNGF